MNIQNAVNRAQRLRQAREEAYSTPLEDFNPGEPRLFQHDTLWPWFERLRNEEPVHYCTNAPIGPYWSVVKYNDIMQVETNHDIFSSDGNILIADTLPGDTAPSFIAMDEPSHSAQRKAVSPMFAPSYLDELAVLIRQRAVEVLDSLPRSETFDFVEKVSTELAVQMLATLFDFPFEERHKLARWSDVATAEPGGGVVESKEQKWQEMGECARYVAELWSERVKAGPRNDLLSMMAHDEATRNIDLDNVFGNFRLLLVGGNDTTRNALSGSLVALNEAPGQYRKLRENPALIESMVPEVIRWQTPLAHMRRTALKDTELGGKTIREGDRVVMWYVSGNRDEEVIDRPDEFIIDRARPRRHLSFGSGIHRCVGARLAELQLRIVWEEILKRFERIEVIGEPERICSSFSRGYVSLPVRIAA
jgi:cytochrome P450